MASGLTAHEEAEALKRWNELVNRVHTPSSASGLSRLASNVSSVPASLTYTSSNVNDILQVANEIEKDNPEVSLYLCEHAFQLSHKVDPQSKGRGVLQFKTGLMSHIKQQMGPARMEDYDYKEKRLSDFYKKFQEKHAKELEIDPSEEDTEGLKERALRRQKILMTQRVLLDAMNYDQPTREDMSQYEKASRLVNILPLEGPVHSKLLEHTKLLELQEVKAAREALALPKSVVVDDARLKKDRVRVDDVKHEKDIFDALEAAFGFQPDNLRNQREHLVLLLANTQSQLCDENMRIVDERDLQGSIDKLSDKILENYVNWCSYVRQACKYNRAMKGEKVALVALYLCMWGEAANVRFLPECICYIYHHMAGELLEMLSKNKIQLAKSCKRQRPLFGRERELPGREQEQSGKGQELPGREQEQSGREQEYPFLEEIIVPVYKALNGEAKKSKGGVIAHSKWRNYDDFNEFFWSNSCFNKLKDWPLKKDNKRQLSFFNHENVWVPKISFVEHRTFLHLYHSFVRVWILLVLMLQGLVVLAFTTETYSLLTLKLLLSLGPTYFIMKFIESVLDILLMIGAYYNSRKDAIVRIFSQFVFYGGCMGALSYLYWKMYTEVAPSDLFFKIFSWVLGSYVALKLLISLLQHIPLVRKQEEKLEKLQITEALVWLYKEHFYIGRGLIERPSDYIRYVLFWVIVLAFKFTFSYFFQIKPLAAASKTIFYSTLEIDYAWHDFISKNNHNALALFFLWAPVVLVYLLDIQIWYILFSAILGGILGAKDRLGEIRSFDMLRNRFHSFPKFFSKKLQHKGRPIQASTMYTKELPKLKEKDNVQGKIDDARAYAPFWNDIINCLREEDYITDLEKDLLIMPAKRKIATVFGLHEKRNAPTFVEWPLFLLASKVFLAVNLVVEKNEDPKEILERLENDEYMSLAVQEAFENVYNLLEDIVDAERGRTFFEDVYNEVKRSIQPKYRKEFFSKFLTDGIENVYKKVTDLSQLLVGKKKVSQDQLNKAVQNIYEAVLHILPQDMKRKQYKDFTHDAAKIFFTNINAPSKETMDSMWRLHLLLTTKESSSCFPKNGEARRRLEFFTNSLFMRMPLAPSVRAMKSFSVLTPYYSEIVMFSTEDLIKDNEDGISILFYLQKIFPDEWQNFLDRKKICEHTIGPHLKKPASDPELELDLRLWASYRGQTLARTVRGMMYYRKALILQASMEESESKRAMAEALADYKFNYVVSCQIYGQQKVSARKEDNAKAHDIRHLLKENPSLRVAFIDTVDVDNGERSYYSKLIKSGGGEIEQVIYSIKLPGDPGIGEGKPENQNHAIIFTRGEALQTIDMNQDNYFEEALKMRNLLEEFKGDHGIHSPTILGVREHVFTGSVSSLAWFMSNQETSFVTLGQRVLAKPLKVRMHYGHPDVFDRLFHITRGGISKASKTINVSGDIFAGFNSTLRRGNVTHHEYIQVGNGRDVGLNQIAMFEAKVSSGNAEQLLSRDVYRLGQLFDFFRMLSFYVTTVGYYVCTMMTTLVVYVFLYGKAYMALSGVGRFFKSLISQNPGLEAALDTQFLYQIGIFTAIPMLMVFLLEEGVLKAIVSFITMQLQLCSVFFTFSLGTRTHYFGQTVLHGGAKYRETGRSFVVQHIKFANNYQLYSRSHFMKALEIFMLLVVIRTYGYNGSLGYFLFSMFMWFLVISWLFAPFIFNPSGFEWQKTVEDFDHWTKWLFSRARVGAHMTDSWEVWWTEGNKHIRSPVGRVLECLLSLRFFFFQYGVVYHLHLAHDNLSIKVYGFSWLGFAGIILLLLIFSFSPNFSVNYQMFLRLIQGSLFMIIAAGLIAVVALQMVTVDDIFASLLAYVPTGWGLLSIGIACKPLMKKIRLWESVRAIAWAYDAAIGMLLFLPIAILSWFPFVSTFQTRLLFNQAFSRGLEISLILAGNRDDAQTN